MKNFLACLQYFPYVLAGVAAVQQSIPTAPGASKKELLFNAITAAGAVGEQVPDAHVQAISKLIDLTVGTLKTTNMLGFGSSVPSPIPAAIATTESSTGAVSGSGRPFATMTS